MDYAIPQGIGITEDRLRIIRHGCVLAGAVWATIFLAAQVAQGWHGSSWDYWSTGLDVIYRDWHPGAESYAYSPAFAQAIWPLQQLPWPVFGAGWALLSLAALAWLSVPVPTQWRTPFVALCLFEVILGNIHLLMAVAIVLGMRYSASWAFVILTKVTPGVGLLWFAVRREWRSLAIAIGCTAAIIAVSYVAAPALWWAWVDCLRATVDTRGSALIPQPPLWFRLPLAVAIIAWGARRNQRWTIAVAAVLGVPHFGLQSLTILAAIPRLNEVQA